MALDFGYIYCTVLFVMNDKSYETTVIKRGRGRPKKVVVHSGNEDANYKRVGLPAMLPPTEHDINEELSMLDSYAYSKYNE